MTKRINFTGYIVSVSTFLIILSCSTKNNENLENLISSQNSIDTVRSYFKSGDIKEIYYEDSQGLKQGTYELYYEGGELRETFYFYNDTIIGFCRFIDTEGRLVELQSEFFNDDNKLTVSERVKFNYDSLGNQIGKAWSFTNETSKNGDRQTIKFTPYFGRSYDSIRVEVNYNGCSLKSSVNMYEYDTFKLNLNQFEKCSDITFNFDLLKWDERGGKLTREIQRVYPIFDGELFLKPWINK